MKTSERVVSNSCLKGVAKVGVMSGLCPSKGIKWNRTQVMRFKFWVWTDLVWTLVLMWLVYTLYIQRLVYILIYDIIKTLFKRSWPQNSYFYYQCKTFAFIPEYSLLLFMHFRGYYLKPHIFVLLYVLSLYAFWLCSWGFSTSSVQRDAKPFLCYILGKGLVQLAFIFLYFFLLSLSKCLSMGRAFC